MPRQTRPPWGQALDGGHGKAAINSRRRSNQTSLCLSPGKLALRPLGLGSTKTLAAPIRSVLAPAPAVVVVPACATPPALSIDRSSEVPDGGLPKNSR